MGHKQMVRWASEKTGMCREEMFEREAEEDRRTLVQKDGMPERGRDRQGPGVNKDEMSEKEWMRKTGSIVYKIEMS